MYFNKKKQLPYIATALLFCAALFGTIDAFARAGGGGGGHSGGGGFSGGGGGYYGHSHGHGSTSPGELLGFIIIIVIVLVFNYYSKKDQEGKQAEIPQSTFPFPEGLDAGKIQNAFLAIQDAWQNKDLRNVRKWLSDGMYQRFTAQFKMMNALDQVNTLSNIRINGISINSLNDDGNYKTAEVAISFTLDDQFISYKYPQLNESYAGDTDVEYWTFIKRTDGQNKNIYDNNNCPNCGAPLELSGGEINRCANCNTLVNNASYDWVLSEITQDEEYNNGQTLSGDSTLKQLMQHDALFSVQRMEDIASNIFMQIMDVFTGSDERRLSRFADAPIAQLVLQQKHSMPPFVFDRLYLNAVTLSGYLAESELIKLYFDVYVTYRRVAIERGLQMIDNEGLTTHYRMELSRSKDFSSNHHDIAFSYECSSCGAPFTDTTNDYCSYCSAPVLDKKRDWVLTGFVLYETLAST